MSEVVRMAPKVVTEKTPIPLPRKLFGGFLVAFGALELAVWECFLVSLHIGSVAVPISALLALVGNFGLPYLMRVATRNRVAMVLPAAIWLVVALMFSIQRPEGDLIVPGDWAGVAFLFTGMVAAGIGTGWQIGKRRKR